MDRKQPSYKEVKYFHPFLKLLSSCPITYWQFIILFSCAEDMPPPHMKAFSHQWHEVRWMDGEVLALALQGITRAAQKLQPLRNHSRGWALTACYYTSRGFQTGASQCHNQGSHASVHLQGEGRAKAAMQSRELLCSWGQKGLSLTYSSAGLQGMPSQSSLSLRKWKIHYCYSPGLQPQSTQLHCCHPLPLTQWLLFPNTWGVCYTGRD